MRYKLPAEERRFFDQNHYDLHSWPKWKREAANIGGKALNLSEYGVRPDWLGFFAYEPWEEELLP